MYSIIGVKKLKTLANVAGSASHTYRTIPTKNADPERQKFNKLLCGTHGDVLNDVKNRLSDVTNKLRKNGVPCLEFMLSTSQEYWEGKKPEDLKKWVKASMDFMKEKYGVNNVVHAMLHLDETTPHIVCYVVPEKNGRLSAREVLGNRQTMRNMHTQYSEAMAQFGLKRGLEGSQAKHISVKKFYSKLNLGISNVAVEVKKLGEMDLPPLPSFWKGQKSTDEAIQAYTGREKGKRRKLAEMAVGALLEASLAKDQVEHLKEANVHLVEKLDQAEGDISRLRERLTESYQELGLSKDQIGALRSTDISLVAQKLGFFGEIKPKENAVDLVKRINDFDYQQAVAWLHHEIGPVKTGMIITSDLQKNEPSRPLTKSENVICKSIKTQTDALGCDKFRISLVPADESKKPYLPGKSKGEEKFYNKEEIINLVPWLRYRNNQGDNVFITPMDDNAYYILLDDARISMEELEKKGFKPCLVQQTSWKKEQIVFKVPKDLDRPAVLAFFNSLNKKVGDEAMTGLRHPFRLAGFRNMKPQHERDGIRPFVTVSLAVNRFCERCATLVRKIMDSKDIHISTGRSTTFK